MSSDPISEERLAEIELLVQQPNNRGMTAGVRDLRNEINRLRTELAKHQPKTHVQHKHISADKKSWVGYSRTLCWIGMDNSVLADGSTPTCKNCLKQINSHDFRQVWNEGAKAYVFPEHVKLFNGTP